MVENFDTTKFLFIANNLSIDFVNTLIVDKGEPLDLLETPADLLAWAIAACLISEDDARKLLEILADEWENSLLQAKKFRRILLETIMSLIESGKAIPTTMNEINRLLRRKSGYEELFETENGFEKRYNLNHQNLTNLLVPIAESASDLLCNGDLKLIKKCESDQCVLYFYDTNKDQKRRWCRMNACGNKAKAAAFYERKKVSK